MTTTGILKRLCKSMVSGRFDWRKYCTPQPYCGRVICVTPLFASYGQIGYTVNFPFQYDMPCECEFDREQGELTIDGDDWEDYIQTL